MKHELGLEQLKSLWREQLAQGGAASVDQFFAEFCGDMPEELRQTLRAELEDLIGDEIRQRIDDELEKSKLTISRLDTASNTARGGGPSGETTVIFAPSETTAPMELRAGTEPIPGFQLLMRLGQGGFGEVWKAAAPGGFQVALKIVPLTGVVGETELQSLDIVKAIRHPNLLATFGSWKRDNYLVIAMELADNTLMDRFNQCFKEGMPGIPREELLEYLDEAAKGIDYLNEPRHTIGGNEKVGIQHRDIKPQNILLVGNGVKVADFGLVRFLESSVTGHTGKLTPSFAAPEFFKGMTSNRSDQYSLAISYCVLRGGRLPFEGTAADLLVGHLMKEPDLSMIPIAEQPIIARALAKDPENRWPSCRAVVDALNESATSPAEPTAAVKDVGSVRSATAGIRIEQAPVLPEKEDKRPSADPPSRLEQLRLRTPGNESRRADDTFSHEHGGDLMASGQIRQQILTPGASFSLRSVIWRIRKLGPAFVAMALLGAAFVLYRTDLLPVVIYGTTPGYDAAHANRLQRFYSLTNGTPPVVRSAIGIELVLVPPTAFQVPPQQRDKAQQNAPWHVVAPRAFYIGRTEVTVGQFREFVNQTGYRTNAETVGKAVIYDVSEASKPAIVSQPGFSWRKTSYAMTDEHPVVHLTWRDAQAFCEWLSKSEKADYRLPTEGEWEHACRGGSMAPWSCGADPKLLADCAWVLSTFDGHFATRQVASKQANNFGLFDMHGNAWEWCRIESQPTAQVGTHVIRGGAFWSRDDDARAAARFPKDDEDFSCGFRVVREIN